MSLRSELRDSMQQCRSNTLTLIQSLDYETFCTQAHPDFSPIGWHVGHLAYTEALWILQRCAGYPPVFPEYHRLFAQDGLPKCDRVGLPAIETVLDYLAAVRSKVLDYLAIAPLEEQERLWKWLIQHESQHAETIAIVLALVGLRTAIGAGGSPLNLPRVGDFELKDAQSRGGMVLIPAGSFVQGSDAIEAQDNERPAHEIYLEDYWIDRHPVTNAEYRSFIEAGGYQNPQWWTKQGWKWLQDDQITHPLYWSSSSKSPILGDLGGISRLNRSDNSPVCGVSWYEADAYARFVGKRLPTEAEWEKAAQFQTMLGEVWQWTATWFESYPNFESYPYPGYSQTYFDQAHRVLKGGSWVTFPWAMRNSFRNWYYPHVREIFSGFRCVSGV
ncbi:ergothioneine biosynthesis protein EgtB [Leptolyngbya sp. NIES-2104]|uniref:ergothioneine biosynthesis protein EgtB n=1 Tax=Leptolyngbya sp. NIES-2104 TaxID=1552121 RepID=UPI001CEC015F|nr:ergothioneine biosynthesis protein EgtB [Leptolyngbya sp. NIES-2104]